MFRTINTLLSERLSSDLGLNAADFGFVTSVYFLVFAIAQIPVGILLDQFGPRRVQSALLLIGALGAALFATSSGFVSVVIARALIGLGFSGSLMAGLKAIVLRFPGERVALVNGYMVMLGALGAVTATAPAEWMMQWLGWRSVFELLAMATAAAATFIFLVVPEGAGSRPIGSTAVGVSAIFANAGFWRIAPLSATCIGSAWSLQALWAASWLTDVDGLDRQSLVSVLFTMGLAVGLGAWLLGTIAHKLRKSGTIPDALLAVVTGLFITAELAIILRLPVPTLVPWAVVALVGAATVISYAMIAEQFPSELAARANGGLNLLHFVWAFIAQYGTGLVVAQWTPQDAHYPAIAYQIAFGMNVVAQVMALAWFVFPRPRIWLSSLATSFLVQSEGQGSLIEVAVSPTETAVMESGEGAEW